MTKWKRVLSVFKASFQRWSDENGARLGAALSYYTAFSIAPMLLLAIAIAGLAFGRDAARGEIFSQITGLVGPQAAKLIQTMLQAADKPASGVIATVIGVLSLLLGASGVMTEMKNALNRLWRVHDRSGIGGFVMARVKAVGMILVIGFLLLVSLAVSAGLAALGKYLHGVLPLPESALHILNNLISLGVITVLFAVLFRFLPDAVIRWHDVWIGAALTSALFVVGKFALGVYLGKGAVGSAYGAAGSVLIVLAWVYYSAQIFYFGAAFTAAYAERLGAGIKEAASRAA